MTKCLMLFFLIIIANYGFSQDIITTIDKKVIQCKVLEVSIDKVRYKNVNIRKSPVFEILKSEVSSIRYKNGYIEKYNAIQDNALDQDSTGNMPAKSKTRNPDEPIDTTKFAMIYFVFNSGSSDDYLFPLYINSREICTLKNSMRLQYKIFSEGQLIIERKSRSYGKEPQVIIDVSNGNVYGINIEVTNPQAYVADRIYSLQLITEPNEVKNFIENEFYGFKPFKTSDLKLQEDLNDLLIQ